MGQTRRMVDGEVMVLFSFSIPQHIPPIQSGQKAQTTRIPRKPRANGAKPYSVGEKVQLYYRSRQKKNCKNCIEAMNCDRTWVQSDLIRCARHSNFFGESVITEIDHYWTAPIDTDFGYEFWMDSTIGFLPDDEKDSWAKLDGFPNGFKQAHEFFYGETGDSNWMFKDLDVIHWDGTKIARRVA